jgi:hypothetical protein
MRLELIFPAFSQDRRIAPCLRIVKDHGLIEKVEAIDLINGAGRRLDVIKDDKCLSFCAKIRLRNDFEDVAVFGEDFFELVGLDTFFKVADLVGCEIGLAWKRKDGGLGVDIRRLYIGNGVSLSA